MAVSLAQQVSVKRLVAAGNATIYYEDIGVSAGAMTELDTSSGAIDTTDQLNMFESEQKVLIVNGTNLKVADFANVKLTVTAMTSPPAKGDILTQDNGSSNIAHMVVDFVNTAKTNIFGYAYYEGSTTAFITTVDISSNNATATMNPSPIPNANISAVTEKPHWYDWTVYPDIVLTDGGAAKSYGTMPNKAYIGCLYRGRAVISGDPEHPNQWYMSRQLFAWDWEYVAGDAQTPVKGNNADAGEIGDIVRALIPYKDDYLIFGCATTMWFMAGDPAHGGSLNELDLTVGIFGANSWCFDGTGNLFFWGTNGLYVTPIPGTPKCITEIQLPKLIKDEAANPSTHRITLGYDRLRAGVLVCITKLSDGSNSNYFYDLKSGGFFPEVYPDECGAYSVFFYASNDSSFADLLVGCKDGYIRKFSDSAKGDDIGASDQAIDSYVTFGPMPMASDLKYKGVLTGLDCVTAGAKPSGDASDSSPITYDVFVGDSAEQVIKKVAADTAPSIAGTIAAPGRRRGGIKRRKVSGVYMSVKLQNNTAAQTWGFEQLIVDLKDFGRFK